MRKTADSFRSAWPTPHRTTITTDVTGNERYR
jgi:hypothetical protein